MKKLPLLLSLLAVLPLAAQQASHTGKAMGGAATCPVEKLQVERLPDMNVPRSGHSALWLNGELTVFGGHTSGFVPTPTAEYFGDGRWHPMEMTYPHDDGITLPLSSGKVLLAGGHSEPLGIGQTFTVEFYDPTTHTFDGFGCLDTKRALARAVEMDSGQVLISGNWYHDDKTVELFDGRKMFAPVKAVTTPRTTPYLLHVAPDDVAIFSAQDTRAVRYDSIIADRIKDGPFHIPLFDTWRPLIFDGSYHEDNIRIGDYTYLLPVADDGGRVAIVKMRGTTFSLLPTTSPIPTSYDGDTIVYRQPIVDRQRQRYYMVGSDQKERFYVLSADYSREPAPLTLFRSDPDYGQQTFLLPVLSPGGDIYLTGGIAADNFHPYSTVYRLLLARDDPAVATDTGTSAAMLIVVIAIAVLLALLLAYIIYIRRHRQPAPLPVEEPAEGLANDDRQKATMQRIRQLMDEQQLFLNSELKINDVAALLNTNARYVSSCINAEEGMTFIQFVNAYRVAYAQQLLSQQPDKKMSGIYAEAGFSGESSFFRIFKSATGLTPKEWRKQEAKAPAAEDE